MKSPEHKEGGITEGPRNTVAAPPLDFSAYSLKDLKSLLDLKAEEALAAEKEDKRGKEEKKQLGNAAGTGGKEEKGGHHGNVDGALEKGGSLQHQGTGWNTKVAAAPKKVIIKKINTSVKLNNNLLVNLIQLPEALEALIQTPFERLQWIDLSFNFLTAVEPVLLKYQNLKALYMHGNKIKQIASVEKLKNLPHLLSLTMNGNPVENCSKYRVYIVAAIPQLKSLDHSSITADEAEMASDWWKAFVAWREKRREEKNEAAYLQNQGLS